MRSPYLDDGDVRLYLGDCIEVLAEMDAESVDAVVCDPPYGIGFMGKAWDAKAIQERVEKDNASRKSLGPESPTRAGRKKPRSSSAFGNAAIVAGPVRDHTLTRARSGSMHAGEYDLSLSANQAFAVWCESWARAAFRVLKPGGHLLAFGGTRTFHRLTCGIEDAGFEIRDCLSWLYGSGFPKSLDVSKAIDKRGGDAIAWHAFSTAYAKAVEASHFSHADVDRYIGIKSSSCYWARTDHRGGMPPRHHWQKVRDLLGLPDEFERLYADAEREVIAERTLVQGGGNSLQLRKGERREVEANITAPATDAAREWQGWGTALKPAWEPCVVARKPLGGTVAENVQQHGTGAINVDGCRIAGAPAYSYPNGPKGNTGKGAAFDGTGLGRRETPVESHPAGRWPANVALDEAAAELLDAASGEITTQRIEKPSTVQEGKGWSRTLENRGPRGFSDTGGASRFFYTAKASRADRSSGGLANNTHPTVKPTDLMRWLVRLVTPPGGLVLDPFAGSGTTLVAARAEGFRAIGIEREEEYAAIIADRLSQLSLFSEAM